MRSLIFMSVRFSIGFFCIISAANAWVTLSFTDFSRLMTQFVFYPETILALSFGLIFGILFLSNTWTKLIMNISKRIKNQQPLNVIVLLEAFLLISLFIYFAKGRMLFMGAVFLCTFIYGIFSYQRELANEHVYVQDS